MSQVTNEVRPLSSAPIILAAQPAPKPYEPSSSTKVPPPQIQSSSSSSTKPIDRSSKAHLPPTLKLAAEFRRLAPNLTETYVAYGATESLAKECARQADYTIPQRHEPDVEIPLTANDEHLGIGSGWWYEETSLLPTFNTWAQITFLHMYLLIARFRTFPSPHPQTWHQHLLDHFSFGAEERM
ncbi:MAG: hypothetical protein Q9190_003976, partial [Brigantiaea leucoxantha]